MPLIPLIKETLIKLNSPHSNAHTHAAEFDTLRFNQRVLKQTGSRWGTAFRQAD